MILLVCIAALLAVPAFGIEGVTNVIISSGNETFGYYLSALVCSLALAVTPAFTPGQRNYGQPMVLGMRSEEIFWYSLFPFLAGFVALFVLCAGHLRRPAPQLKR
ncbi:MAG: hypothetical protein ACT4NU_14275 [Chromatiales bacterium]